MSNLKYFIFTMLLYSVHQLVAQITFIPDPVFEQFLINSGFDTDNTINGQVLTSDIEFITFLEINETPPIYAINDFTGIQDFASLEGIRFNVTNPTFIDFGNLLNLRTVDGNTHPELTSINLSGCPNLEFFNMIGTSLDTLILPQTNTLEIFSCTNGLLTNLDLSFYSALSSISVGNNQLESLNVANGNNTNVTFFSSTGNPNLSCIIVDDVAYSEENWTFIDPTTAFCDALNVNEVAIETLHLYPNPVTHYFQINSANTPVTTVDIIDLTGKKVKSFAKAFDTYSIQELPKGVYLIYIDTTLGTVIQKLIVE